MDPAHVDALIGSATETEEDEEELVVVEERTDSGSPTSHGEYEEYEVCCVWIGCVAICSV